MNWLMDDFQKAWTLQPSIWKSPCRLLQIWPYWENMPGKNRAAGKRKPSIFRQFPGATGCWQKPMQDSGNPEQALLIYNDMIAKDSLDPETLYEKALLLEQMKDTAQAIAALQKAYAIQGVDTYGLELAHLYAEQKNPKAWKFAILF